MKTYDKPEVIQLPKVLDERGNLSFFQNKAQIPFSIARAYWIYDVPGGEVRGAHAYHSLQEFIVALSGSFDVILDDGKEELKFTLNRSYFGLYIPRMYWRKLENFSTNSLALIVADQPYSEGEYIRDYDQFIQMRNNGQ